MLAADFIYAVHSRIFLISQSFCIFVFLINSQVRNENDYQCAIVCQSSDMASIAFPDVSKVLKLSTGVTYNYVFIPAKSSKPTILFLHGFPSSSYDWRHQIAYFLGLDYGIIAPDLLGYGGTDKPSSVFEYLEFKMSKEVLEILDHEKIEKVHGVAHDMGVYVLSRMNNYFPERFLSSSFLAGPYRQPARVLDLEAIDKMNMEKLGYTTLGYYHFNAREDAAEVMAAHVSFCLLRRNALF
jgi:soluble epoxide hydrolase/lipid-phosphate phosphatase